MSTLNSSLPKPSRLVLFDGMAMIYRAYYALNGAPRTNSKGMNTGAILGFTTTLYDLTQPMDVNLDDSFLVVICVSGSGLVDGEHIRAGETLLVPACRNAASCIPSSEGLKLLVSRC